MGGSIAKALRENFSRIMIYAFDKNKATLKKAAKEKVIDKYLFNPPKAQINVDIIIFALPVLSIIETFKKFSRYINSETIITDVGSSKNILTTFFSNKNVKYIGSHPLAGSEKFGYIYSDSAILKDKTCLVIKNEKLKMENRIVSEMWKKIGMKTKIIESNKHDKILAITSHFIHIMAFSYIHFLKEQGISDLKDFSGPSFEEIKRLAKSNPEMWSDIILDNKKELNNIFNSYHKSFYKFFKKLSSNSKREILKLLNQIYHYDI